FRPRPIERDRAAAPTAHACRTVTFCMIASHDSWPSILEAWSAVTRSACVEVSNRWSASPRHRPPRAPIRRQRKNGPAMQGRSKPMDETIHELLVSEIELDPNQPRKDPGDLEGLKRSIAQLGLLQPPVVTPEGPD